MFYVAFKVTPQAVNKYQRSQFKLLLTLTETVNYKTVYLTLNKNRWQVFEIIASKKAFNRLNKETVYAEIINDTLVGRHGNNKIKLGFNRSRAKNSVLAVKNKLRKT